MLGGDCIGPICQADVILCRRDDNVGGQFRLECLRFRDFFIDLRDRKLRWRPNTASFALHTGSSSTIEPKDVNAVLRLPTGAVANDLRVIPDARKEIGAISSNLSQLGGGRSCSLLESDMRGQLDKKGAESTHVAGQSTPMLLRTEV